MENRIQVVCAECQDLIAVKPPPPASIPKPWISYGLCPKCYRVAAATADQVLELSREIHKTMTGAGNG